MANAQLMEEELQQSVVLSEEDAEFEEDDIVQDATMVGTDISIDPGPNIISVGHVEGLEEEDEEDNADIDIEAHRDPGRGTSQQDELEGGPANDEDADHEDDESESEDDDIHDEGGAFEIDAEGEEEEEDDDDDDEEEDGEEEGEEEEEEGLGFQPKSYVGEDGEFSDEDEGQVEEDIDEEEEEDEAEGVGAVKIKPGETDDEDSESEPSDDSDSAFSDRGSGAESDEAVENEEEDDDVDEEFDTADPPLRGDEASDSDSEAGTPNGNMDAEGDVDMDMDDNDAMEGDLSPSSARRASAPQIARDLLPPQRGLNKPDSHSMFNQLVLDEDPMDGSRVLRKRKTSSAEAEEDAILLRKRRRNTPDESAYGDTAHEQANGGETLTRPRSARSLRLKVSNSTLCSIVKKTRSSLVVKMRVNTTDLGQILRNPKPSNKKRSGGRATNSQSRTAASRNNATVTSAAEPPNMAPFFASSFSQPFYSFYDKETDELKGKPYGGILTEEQADTTKTLPTKDDRRRFDEAKQKAEEEWRNRLLAMQAEAEVPAKKSKKASGPVSQIECIEFGGWEIDTWYAAPYPEEYSRNRVLYICEFCLKYMNSDYVAWRHKLKCPAKHPPGDEIYRHGSISFFEVDGRKNPVYCQNLCLLAKLFLGSKTLYYDVEPFLFYVLCEYDDLGYHFVGYFSKEKRASSQNNVSCILTLPIHQRKGYGHLLIDFSYLLTRVEEKSGSPEKPLSDMGLVSYRNYWRLVLCRYLIEHVPEDKAEKRGISIRQMSDDTGMTPDDVVSALEALRFLVRDPITHVYAFRVDLPYCHKEVAKWEAKSYVKLHTPALTWTPYIMGRGNATNFELGPALNAIAPREEDEETKHVDVNTNTAIATDSFELSNSLAQKRPLYGTPAVLESTEPSDMIITDAFTHVRPNGIIRENANSLRPSEQDEGQVSTDSVKDDERGWHRQYENIPVTRFQVFPPISKRPGMSRAGSSIARPIALPRTSSTIRTPAQPRPRPRARRSTGGSVRKSAQRKTSTTKRKTGGTGRGPGRWPKGTKKSDYGNADSGPGLPPAWIEKQKQRLALAAGTDADEEIEMHDTVQVQVNETTVEEGRQVETISARFEVKGDDEAHPESAIQSSASSTTGGKANVGFDDPTSGEDIIMDQAIDYDEVDAPGEEEH
ncbi:hypothetical protein ONZ43_g254 [Nemania bipapillata]|uniref:Uncharacterized protein n=1 Tax=Nemania bipapillata TaxID=110536 RepID=A0ACC2J993_9PEZI|nr:hypothetical protein ONZ43_g254 [Nemania bipapillata]